MTLAGYRVVVTRSRPQASALAGRLAARGAEVVELPVIAVVDPPDGGEDLRRAARELAAGAYAWVALTSSNAVHRLAAAATVAGVGLGPAMHGGVREGEPVRWAVVGVGTAAALARVGADPDLRPERSTADALAAAFPSAPPGGGRVLVPQAEVTAGSLAAGLRGKGWDVEEVVAYRTVAATPDAPALAAARSADAITFASSSAVAAAVAALGRDGIPPVVATIGPVTSAAVRDAGLAVDAEADPSTLDGLVAAVERALAGPASARR